MLSLLSFFARAVVCATHPPTSLRIPNAFFFSFLCCLFLEVGVVLALFYTFSFAFISFQCFSIWFFNCQSGALKEHKTTCLHHVWLRIESRNAQRSMAEPMLNMHSCTEVRRLAFITGALDIHFPAACSWDASHVSLASTSACRECQPCIPCFHQRWRAQCTRISHLSSFIPCHSVQYHTMGYCCSGHNRMPCQFSLPPRPRQSGCHLTQALDTTGTAWWCPPLPLCHSQPRRLHTHLATGRPIHSDCRRHPRCQLDPRATRTDHIPSTRGGSHKRLACRVGTSMLTYTSAGLIS